MITNLVLLGNQELANTERAISYGMPIACVPCHLPIPCDPNVEYGDILLAPWYDANFPESTDVLGFTVLKLDGLDSTLMAESGNTYNGGWIGRQKGTLRTLTFTMLVEARTCCALQYALRWLEAQLDEHCGTRDLYMYDCCPPDGLTDEEIIEKYLRIFADTKLIKGIEVLSQSGDCDDCSPQLAEIQFSLGVKNTNVLSTPVFNDPIILDGECACTLAENYCCPPVPKKLVERQMPKRRRPITVKDDGTWCPIGWNLTDYNPITDFLVVDNIDATRTTYPIRVGSDLRWTAIGWSSGGIDLCDQDIVIAEICGTGSTEPECTQVNTDAKILRPIRIEKDLSNGGSWQPVGWDHSPAQFPLTVYDELVIENECDCTLQEYNCNINVNLDGTWQHDGEGLLKNLYHCGELTIMNSQSGFYTIMEEVDFEILPPPCGTFTRRKKPLIATKNSCGCEPVTYKQACTILPATTSFYDDYLTFKIVAETEWKNTIIELFPIRQTKYTNPCSDDPAEKRFWACQTPCWKLSLPLLPAGSTFVYDASREQACLNVRMTQLDTAGWVVPKIGGLYGQLPDCRDVAVRIRTLCDENHDVSGSWFVGSVKAATVSL